MLQGITTDGMPDKRLYYILITQIEGTRYGMITTLYGGTYHTHPSQWMRD